MTNLYVTGGRQKKRILKNEEEWNLYERALIFRLDPATLSCETCVDYVTPPGVRPSGETSILFKGGTLEDGRLYVCTSTEALVYAVPEFNRVGYVSLPCFNDLHHVSPTREGALLAVSTGLDMVVEFSPKGVVSREWGVLGTDPWTRFSKQVDYRLVATTKPHRSHPNFVFQIDQDIWVTRFVQRDAICLTHPCQRIEIGVEKPHDGLVRGDKIYFTTVDGHLVIVDKKTLQVAEVVDLNLIDNERHALLGWCRGLCVVDEKLVWVGFTRVRKTKFKENINWVKHAFRATEKPTHIALYDLAARKRLQEVDLEPYGMNLIFGIFPAEGRNMPPGTAGSRPTSYRTSDGETEECESGRFAEQGDYFHEPRPSCISLSLPH
jgi:hypothetical protein